MQNHLLSIIDGNSLSLEIIHDSTPSFDTPLLFNNDIDISNVKNLLLIDSIVAESQLFFDSSNQNTFPIIYSNNSNREDFIQLLENKFSNGLERIAFVFHDNIKDGKAFLNQELFFSEDFNSYSPNTQLLIDIIKKFGVKYVDFLACNSLNYANWVNFYELLRKETNVIVGASNDKTGNLKHGGNWVMENTNENVLSTYFNSNINSYVSTLAVTVLSTSTVITQALVNSYTWPVTVNGGTSANPVIITFGENISITNVSQYFITGSSYITYDGTGKIITISSVSSYPGLIQNGINGINGYSNITIQNINSAISGSSTLAVKGGYICQNYFGRGVNNILVNNCSNTGAINNDDTGGIIGGETVNNGGKIIITNCSNSGFITSNNAGGICGRGIASFNGNISITNCSNTGNINGSNAGGICGYVAGFSDGIISITICSNTGIINGAGAGGITGGEFGITNNNLCSVINCSNTGDINGNSAGGICGTNIGLNYDGRLPKILMQNCYSLGNIATTCGGICGGGTTIYVRIPIINITNCYTVYNSIAVNGSPFVSSSLSTNVRNAIILRYIYSSLTNAWSDTNASSALSGALNIYRNSKLYKYYSNFGEVWYSNQNNTPFFLTSDLDSVPRRQRRD